MPATRTRAKPEPAEPAQPARRRGRPTAKPPTAVFVEPAEPAPPTPKAVVPAGEVVDAEVVDDEAETPEFAPRLVDGEEVVKDEPLRSPLPRQHADGSPIMFRGYRLLTLASGRQVHACAECPDVTGSRGDIQRHRVEVHGMAQAGRRPRSAADEAESRQAQERRIQTMTVGELLVLARHVDDWEALFDRQAVQIATLEEELMALRRWKAKMERAFDRVGFTPKIDDEE